MKKRHPILPAYYGFSLCFLMLCASALRGESVAPKVLDAKGTPQAGDQSIGKGGALKVDDDLNIGDDGALLIGPTPGQILFVDESTKAKFLGATIDSGPGGAGDLQRSSKFSLTSGHLHSSVVAPKEGTNVQQVITPCGTLTSNGGNWSTWSEGPVQIVAVYAGTVALQRGSGDATVIIRPGQVAKWRCDGDQPTVEIVDLRTGRVHEYLNGTEIGARLATPNELKEARGFLVAGLGPFIGTSSDLQRLEFAQIVPDINEILAQNLLPPIDPPPGWALFPNALILGRPGDFASPEQPQP